MEKLIEDLMKTNIQPPAYRRIQEFITKVSFPFSCFILSFLTLQQWFIFYFFWNFVSQIGAGCFHPNTKPKLHTGIDLLLPMGLRTYECLPSRPLPRMFLSGTSGLILTLRYCLPLLVPTSMITTSLSLPTPLILRSLNQFTIGPTQKINTLPKIGLAWMTSIFNRSLIPLNW